MPPRRRYPLDLVCAVAVSALLGRRRSLLADMARLAATLDPPLHVMQAAPKLIESIRPKDKLLIVFNHYTRPGAPAWWTATALGAALGRLGLTRPEPRWVMTAGWRHLGMLAPLSQWAFRQIARTYSFFLMPPMPPDPDEADARAATVRQVIAYARRTPDARVCLAPEGYDSDTGRLNLPPSGMGRFVLHLCQAGMALLPAGVWVEAGAWHVNLGEVFTLAEQKELAPDKRDEWASRRVMQAIAELLPEPLR